MEKTIEQIYEDALTELEGAGDGNAVEALSVRYLGRKGIVTQFLRNISTLPPEQRPEAGKKANELKQKLDAAFTEALQKLEAVSTQEDGIDVSLPGRTARQGSIHPITRITWQISDIFTQL